MIAVTHPYWMPGWVKFQTIGEVLGAVNNILDGLAFRPAIFADPLGPPGSTGPESVVPFSAFVRQEAQASPAGFDWVNIPSDHVLGRSSALTDRLEPIPLSSLGGAPAAGEYVVKDATGITNGYELTATAGTGVSVTYDAVPNPNTVKVAGIDASTSVKGVAQFDSGDFSVAAGVVSLQPHVESLDVFGVAGGPLTGAVELEAAGDTTIDFNAGRIRIASTGSSGVTGPASSTVDNLAAWNDTAGNILKDAGIATADVLTAGLLSVVNSLLGNIGGTVQGLGVPTDRLVGRIAGNDIEALTSAQVGTFLDHEDLVNSDGNKHIDWTNATQNFLTTGDAQANEFILANGGETLALQLTSSPTESYNIVLPPDKGSGGEVMAIGTIIGGSVFLNWVANGGGGGASTAANFVTWAADGGLTNDRVLTGGAGVSVNVTGGDGQPVTIEVDHDAITNYVANEHIDWTAAVLQNFNTTGTGPHTLGDFELSQGIRVITSGNADEIKIRNAAPDAPQLFNVITLDVHTDIAGEVIFENSGTGGLTVDMTDAGTVKIASFQLAGATIVDLASAPNGLTLSTAGSGLPMEFQSAVGTMWQRVATIPTASTDLTKWKFFLLDNGGPEAKGFYIQKSSIGGEGSELIGPLGEVTGMTQLEDDPSPQLGADLNITDSGGTPHAIVSNSGDDIIINPGGTASTRIHHLVLQAPDGSTRSQIRWMTPDHVPLELGGGVVWKSPLAAWAPGGPNDPWVFNWPATAPPGENYCLVAGSTSGSGWTWFKPANALTGLFANKNSNTGPHGAGSGTEPAAVTVATNTTTDELANASDSDSGFLTDDPNASIYFANQDRVILWLDQERGVTPDTFVRITAQDDGTGGARILGDGAAADTHLDIGGTGSNGRVRLLSDIDMQSFDFLFDAAGSFNCRRRDSVNEAFKVTQTSVDSDTIQFVCTAADISMTNVLGDMKWTSVGKVELSGTQLDINPDVALFNGLWIELFSSMNGIRDANQNELLLFTQTASAVNELTIANAATGGDPTLSATGTDADIDLAVTPKGTGSIVLDGLRWPNADGAPNQVLTTDGAGTLSWDNPTEVVAHADLTDMPDTGGTNTDHDVRYVPKVQTGTPATPTPFTGMLWYDTDENGTTFYAQVPLATKTGNYTLTNSDVIVLGNGTLTLTLPTAVGISGRMYYVKNISTGTVTLDGDGSETIDNQTTQTLAQDEAMTVVSDGTEWWII